MSSSHRDQDQRPPCSEQDLLDHLDPEAHRELCGTELERDLPKLRRLASIVPEHQWSVARQVLSLGVPFDDAILSYEAATPGPVARTVRHTKRVRVEDLKPNAVNGSIFWESLAEASIEDLAEDIERHGQRQLIEVNENDEILDGERRWRAELRRDPDATIEVVVVPGVTTTEQIEAYIYDAYASVRDATLVERVNVYALARRVLKARFGRPVGQPSKMRLK